MVTIPFLKTNMPKKSDCLSARDYCIVGIAISAFCCWKHSSQHSSSLGSAASWQLD